MKVACIVSEYNPFHKGHAYHIDETRRAGATHVVAIMSGAFVQRGEPAAFSKFARAKAAVLSGADLVLELPVRYALSSSERFAFGAVSLAKGIGCADMLSFGCEAGDIEGLKKAAAAVSREDVRARAKALSEEGLNYAEALSQAVAELSDVDERRAVVTNGTHVVYDLPPSALSDEKSETAVSDILCSPNNLLAVDYLRALAGSGIEPLAIKRSGNEHDGGPEGDFASASFIRKSLGHGALLKEYLPPSAADVFSHELSLGRVISNKNIDGAVLYCLRNMDKEAFRSLPDCTTGLGDRLYAASRTAKTVQDLCDAAKTRRYTMSRVRRAVMCAVVGIFGNDFPPAPYARILAIGTGGQEILARIKRSSNLPLSASLGDFIALGGTPAEYAVAEARATDIQALMFKEPAPCGEDYTIKLFKEENHD